MLTTDQLAFQESARDFLSRQDQAARIRRTADRSLATDLHYWKQITECGWPAILIPDVHSGLDLGMGEMRVVCQEMGSTFCTDPLVSVGILSVSLLTQLPSSPLRDETLEGIATGCLTTLAWQTEAGQLSPTLSTVQIEGQSATLSAKFLAVTPLQGTQYWLIPALYQQTPTLFRIAATHSGIHLTPEARIDGSDYGVLILDKVSLNEQLIVAQGATLSSCLDYALDQARIAIAAQLLGLAERTLQMTLDYVSVREQFSQAIGSFQSVQHRLVDAYIQIQLLSNSLSEALNDRQTYTSEDLSRLASRLKVRAHTASDMISRLAIQLFGGMGYSDESDVGLALKRAIALNAELGTARAHLQRFGQLGTTAQNTVVVESGSTEQWQEFPQDADWNAMDEATFRGMLRSFYKKHYPEHLRHINRRLHWHQIGDWYKTLSKQGWIAPAWPKKYGGMELSPDKQIALIEEQEHYGVGRPPDQGLVMLGPILFQYGTQEQKDLYLPAILSGEHVWAQGYSEPNAGSDLASLRCEAVIDGDDFIVTGQKTWSTLAQDASHMFMLVRTDKTVKKQAGISFLLVDLSSPGVQIRPIKTIAGDEEFCEVFFDQVRVPQSNLVGKINEGWNISKSLLGLERLFSGSPKHAKSTLGSIDKILNETHVNDAGFMQDYYQCQLDLEDLSASFAYFSDIVKQGQPLPAHVSMLKIWATETHERTGLLLLEAAKENAATAGPCTFTNTQGKSVELDGVQIALFNSAAAKIFSGTNEIQRNILAKMVLKLPTSK